MHVLSNMIRRMCQSWCLILSIQEVLLFKGAGFWILGKHELSASWVALSSPA